MLPPFVAYERQLIDKCTAHCADKIIDVMGSDGVLKKRNLYFHHFPFVYKGSREKAGR
jgi:hypothetical protein